MKYRIMIEIKCDDCQGSGESGDTDFEKAECEACSGTGYLTDFISLEDLKLLMDQEIRKTQGPIYE